MILITGGTGFLGDKLIHRLVYDLGTPMEKIRVVARNEGKLIDLKQKYYKIDILTGDIADDFTCCRALKDVDTVYHLAAFKHVGLAEDIPYECTKTNVVGTLNLLQLFQGKLFVAISTDKAAQVAGVYGATKFLMERLIAEYQYVFPSINYRVVRYGNVLYSTGSVLCKWKELIQSGKEITVTDPKATRFFWTVDQAVDLIFECIDNASDAKPYIPKMKAMRISDLADAMYIKYGLGEYVINQIGLQPGENMHETMDGIIFSNDVEQYSVEEILELI